MMNEYDERIQHTIFRALALRYAGLETHDKLFEVLISRSNSFREATRFALGLAIGKTATRSERDSLYDIACDSRYGEARLWPLNRLARWHDRA